MAAAGLTHGGFYAHLRSKDDVVAQAIGQMFDAAYANPPTSSPARRAARRPRGSRTTSTATRALPLRGSR